MDGDPPSDEERWTREYMRVEIPLKWALHLEAYWASREKRSRWEETKGVTCLMHSAVLAREAFFKMSHAERLKWGTSTEDVTRMATALANMGITPPAATSADTLPRPEPNGKELVSSLVQRFWPEEGGWCDAIITDYHPTTNEHCLTYEINTPNETFEWADISQFDGREFKLLEDRVNIEDLKFYSQGMKVGAETATHNQAIVATHAAVGDVNKIVQKAAKTADVDKIVEAKGTLNAQEEALRAQLAALDSDSDSDED